MASNASQTRRAARERLRDIIQEKSFLYGDFTLSSGRSASYFLDMKPTMLDPEGANLIADLMLEAIGTGEVDAVGGLAAGCIPIVTLVTARSFHTPRPISGFFVRKEPKGHGTNKLIDGNLRPGMAVVLVEDVTTTGQSVMRAVMEARQMACKVERVVTVVDRLEGARENLDREGIELIALFNRDEFR
ncbi:MAG: orotate phosphoribosyltransferase [Alphaproteobacteria bacterium]|nr:orotate phosphoribosyltransferase [Alphaproteobacteria bacterium]